MDLRPQTPLLKLMEDDFWGAPLRSNASNKSFRPLTVLSFRINYALHQLDPFGE
jgi:protein O-mannosyl-transferase